MVLGLLGYGLSFSSLCNTRPTYSGHFHFWGGAGLQAEAHQLLREFQRYQLLVKRPVIRRALIAEREALLGQLGAHNKHVRAEFQAKMAPEGAGKDGGPPAGKNQSATVNTIVWLRQLAAKVPACTASAPFLPFCPP